MYASFEKKMFIYMKICMPDTQICPLEIASFGHTASDIQYMWAEKPLRYSMNETTRVFHSNDRPGILVVKNLVF